MTALRVFVLSLIAWIVILGTLWLLPAGLAEGGTWKWHRGWWAVGLISVVQAMGSAYFAAHSSASNKKRDEKPAATKDQQQSGWRNPAVDVVGTIYVTAFLAFIPFDVFRLHLLPLPASMVSTTGAIISILGLLLMHASIAQHIPTSCDPDSGPGPRIIDTGFYGIVRHPMYFGAWLWLVGATVWLGSFAALILSLGVLVFMLVRISIEETHLRDHMPGYAKYSRKVRSRLLPFVL